MGEFPNRATQFKPGNKLGTQGGRLSRLPPEIRALRKKNQAELILMIYNFFKMTTKEALQKTEGPETTQLENAVQGLISKCKEGDSACFKVLVELVAGKIPESDHDEFSEEDLRILNKIKEVRVEREFKQPSQVEHE